MERGMLALAFMVVFLDFLLVFLLLWRPWASSVDATVLNTINIALGSLLAFGSMVLGYYFGSSKSSADKTKLIEATKPAAAPAVPK